MNNIDIFYQRRLQMVENQLKSRGITDKKVLNAMLKIERHKFIPKEYQDFAYIDEPLPIGYNQTISQPYIVALMTQLLELKGEERVLEIGTGSGYQAAVLAEIVKEVYTIEIIPQLASRAERTLKELGYTNFFIKVGNGYLGWPEYAPFDRIIVTCAPDHIPQPLIDQLKDEGKIVIPVGDIYQELVVVEKHSNKISKRSIIPVRFVPMIKKENENNRP
ncbi:MAG: protein-L-isoaspartate(D-aspartate) O-methyltransferase [Endomicrobia bacterium]|nr:protein-L-isoaspartate(D-aspartate) O-methyltransferase [Endomicrobiia bacterium]